MTWPALEFEAKGLGLAFEEILDEPFEQEAAPRQPGRSLNLYFPIILGEHRVAGGLQEEHGSVVHIAIQQGHVMGPQAPGFVEIALAESRATATFSPHGQGDLESGRFEHLTAAMPICGSW